MATLAGAIQAADDMVLCGERAPSLKLALMFSVCSGANKLDGSNSSMADILRDYATQALPDHETICAWLRATKGRWSGLTVTALQAIDALWVEGLLDSGHFGRMPGSEDAWQEWRRRLVSRIPGAGYKMVSFAAYLMWPHLCPLVIVDRHHLRRLGLNPDAVPQPERQYRTVEDLVRWEHIASTRADVSVGVWAHYKWSEQRQATGAETASDACADHTRLSVRNY